MYWQNMDTIQDYLEDMKKGYYVPSILPQLYTSKKDIYNFEPKDLEMFNYVPKNSYKVEVVE